MHLVSVRFKNDLMTRPFLPDAYVKTLPIAKLEIENLKLYIIAPRLHLKLTLVKQGQPLNMLRLVQYFIIFRLFSL